MKYDFSIGVPLIDAQHQSLFNAVDRIYAILSDGDLARDQRMAKDAIFFLQQHTIRHFQDEEAYMRSICDGNYDLHKAQHDAILVELEKKKEEIVSSGYSPDAIRRLLGTLLSWLTYHTREVDRLIGQAPTKAESFHPAAVALDRAITQVLTDMLQITPKLVDPTYDGSMYGNELFCVVSGTTVASELLHILYAVDLQVIEQAVGKLLGIPVTQTDDLVLSAFEELCRVLSIHFVKEYRSNTFFHIEHSHVAKEDQLPALIPASSPLCSVLFNEPYGSLSIRIWQSGLQQ